MKFSELNLNSVLQKNLDNLGYEDATPIQQSSFEHIAAGKDLAGLAQTGTGKTAAFLIPMIERMLTAEKQQDSIVQPFENWTRTSFILILVPTRELAEQVHENVIKLTQGTEFKSTVLYGGTSYDDQKQALNEGVEFVVSTPGRLIDLFKGHFIDLKQVKAIVFDEADRMFDMGFKDDMRFLLERIPKDRQYLVYSATLDFEVLNTAYEFGANPIEVNVSKDETKAENVTHEILHLGQKEKPQFLFSLIQKLQPKQLIIFTNFKSNVDRVSQFLNNNNIRTHGISSLLSQKQRTRIMSDFKEAKVRVLVATDVAARGLDVKGVDLVINFDLPDDAATYVHRIGRTGRAEETGKAFSLVSDLDVAALSRIETLLGDKISIGWMETEDILEDFKPFPHRTSHNRLHSTERKKQQARKSNHKSKTKGDRRHKPRQQDENKEKKFAKKRAPQAESFKKEEKQVHRDRTRGRHGSDAESKTKNKNIRKRTSHKKRGSSSKVRTRTRASAPPAPSVTGKLTKFIKNLFG